MILIPLIMSFVLCTILHARFIFYYTEHHTDSYLTFDCIYAYLEEDHRNIAGPFTRSYYLIPYCRRPDNNEILDDASSPSDTTIHQMISFSELKQRDITTTQLLQWMVPIDVVERYENYNEYSDDDDDEVFYNCSLPWFGSKCQYRFDFDTSHLFGDLVNVTFSSRLDFCRQVGNETCYPFLTNCSRGPSPICLDWREICDGKLDCLNGEDEYLCEELELNECLKDEYRCHYGGQCIPLEFVEDGQKNIDCLDGSDETDAQILTTGVAIRWNCHTIPTFACEERTCRYPHSFSCGDGDCVLFYSRDTTNRQCFTRRRMDLTRLLLTTKDSLLNETCQDILLCLLRISNNVSNTCFSTMLNDLDINQCPSLDNCCLSDWIAIPSQPILSGFFQFIYFTNRSIDEFKLNVLPDFVCFNLKRCSGLLSTTINIEFSHGLICSHISHIISVHTVDRFDHMESTFREVIQRCLTIGTELSSSNASLFHCPLSLKCISYHRLVDGFTDCYYGEDESYPSCQLNDSTRYACLSNTSKCLSTIALGNLVLDCPKEEDESISSERFYLQQPPFPYFCNNQQEILSYYIDFADEEYCELWPCNTPYVRCNKLWNCLNGIDELNCPDNKCSSNQHQCELLQYSKDFICLSIEHLYDKYLDNCSLAAKLRREVYYDNQTEINTIEYLSWTKTKCITYNQICSSPSVLQLDTDSNECLYQKKKSFGSTVLIEIKSRDMTDICWSFATHVSEPISPFTITLDLGFFPPLSTTRSLQSLQSTTKILPTINNVSYSWYCNRGILIRYHSHRNPTHDSDKCLCPPSYFGNQCQWQNQRISLTLKLTSHSLTSTNTVFQLIIMLIDQNGFIMPYHEQITFIPTLHCSTKFNIYLLYPHRPKNTSTIYSIRIDIYHQMTLHYYGSWHLSIPYHFLPVNRIVTKLFITDLDELTTSCPLVCGKYGQCQSYQNNKSLHFCRCQSGYSGSFCNIQHHNHCSNHSLSISSSICLCPSNRFGPRCYLKHSICHSTNNPCQHNGICIPNDYRITNQLFICICNEGYSGHTCEINNNRIEIQFNETLIKTVSTVQIHLITIFSDKHHERTTLLKKIPYDHNTVTVYVQQPFHILLTQLTNQTYYLTVVRETYIKSENITTQVKSHQRCQSINELFNSTFINYHPFRRVKYYPYLCRQHQQIMCFYDDIYICLCDINRFSNCFEFNHNMTYDCQQQNYCQNNGRCLVNNLTCPTMSICICDECYYGRKCQFTTKGFILSLDSIIGYQIKPNISISRQPTVIKVSIGIITFMFTSGIISSLLSIMTFRMKQPREVGCGWYLLTSSIVSLCALTLLKIKFWHLILSQKGFLTNRSYLSFNCKITDASLKILLSTNEWLNVCVMIERMLTAKIGPSFNKSLSKKIAKRMIFVILLLSVLSYVHDPFYYELIDDIDIDEKRTWCFVSYSKAIRIYNTIISIFHFIVPFAINIISSIFLVLSTARRRSKLQPNIAYSKHIKQEIKQHKYILFPPCILVLLTLPRLVITFMSGCMKSPRDPSLYLIGYFLSFVPMTLHFYVFVRPSKQYMKIFDTAIQQTMRQLRLRSRR